VSLLVRPTRGAPTNGAALLREIRALDPTLAPPEVVTLREQVDRKSSPQRIAAVLLAALGGLALLLAAIGLYGVMAQAVAEERRELGLRIALGATGARVLRRLLGRALVLVSLGILIGAALALASSRLLAHLLYGIGPRDPLAYGAALAVTLIVAAAASWLPARRAMRSDPVQSLRG
jgi:ABC-type antimicrobial peptide transport system permease subunit